jgi:hypothetical protein
MLKGDRVMLVCPDGTLKTLCTRQELLLALIDRIHKELTENYDELITKLRASPKLMAKFMEIGAWAKRIIEAHDARLAAQQEEHPRQKRSPLCRFQGCWIRVHDDSRHVHVSWFNRGSRYHRDEFCCEAHAAAHLWFGLPEETRKEYER